MTTFASRITRTPRAYEPDRGAEAAALFPDLPPETREVITGAGGCSPYLKGLMERETTWAAAALTGRPETALADLMAETARLDGPSTAKGLRQAKRRLALLTGLADLAGVWSLEEVTGALTRFADLCVARAIATLAAGEIAKGNLAGATLEDAETGAGMVAIAMGKMGAHELNYSSDIDLICLFDDGRYDAETILDARGAFVRITRKLAAMLGERTSDGYVFRTDLRLRPDPAVTPVCLSMDAAERYYESVGRTWERAAYIKARACAGDVTAGETFLKHLTPFVWRKHLDYAAIRDAHDIRLKIREHKALHGALKLEGHDMKLGTGGIREIEFFTQTRQLIAGGRDPELRVRNTVDGLKLLAQKGWEADATTLIDDYRAHREVEHRIQMVADQQTHNLPNTADGIARIAAMMDRDTADLRTELTDRLTRVSHITEGFFSPGEARPAPELSTSAEEIVAQWPSYPALRSPRAVEIFGRVQPEILSRLSRAARPEEALVHIDGFLRGLPAGVQLFSMFDANPHLIDLVVDIAATAPDLARYLARHSGVFDAVIGGDFFAAWPGAEALTDDLTRQLGDAPDYEAQLSTARRWRNEWHFRVGVHHLRGLTDSEEAGQHYADVAGAILAALWDPVVAEFATKHGPPPGRGATVVGMGSLGSARLTATSDLDLIVIYDTQGVETSEGRRPLAARVYYARLTQAFVTALTAPLGEGRLYEVDMRLRPSGRQGPVATSLNAFKEYQKNEAWTWEHLALTRARPVAGTHALGAEVEAFRCALLSQHRDQSQTLADVSDMRARLAGAKPGDGAWDMKSGPGRLQDIALLAQTGALLSGAPARGVAEQLAQGQGALGLSDADCATLIATEALLWHCQAAARLMTATAFDADAVGAGGRAFLRRGTGADDIGALTTLLEDRTTAAAAIIAAALDKESAGDMDG
ncbi:MAG: glutamine-synthetase adenylyltransferase [Pseudomonadota bacterium]